MNKKTIIIIVSTFVVCIVLAIVGMGCMIAWHVYQVKQYNQEFEQEYRKKLNSMELMILSENRYIEISSGIWSTRQEDISARGDAYGDSYYHEYELYDKQINFAYTVYLHHAPRGKIEAYDDLITTYRELAQKYEANFEVMRDIIEEHGGQAERLTTFQPQEVDNYILLVYLPDAESMIETQNDLYDRVYGGYADAHLDVTNGINVDIPRFIFCANEDTYKQMCAGLDEARNYVYGKEYACRNSKATSKQIRLNELCEILLGDRTKEYVRVDVADTNTLGSPVSRNYLMSVSAKDWIALYELEVGVDYYLTVYEKR
ncbi:MAG: hypothetical protein IJ794_19000 [Lachnospiraceae bacterium]|nr:hypothetical protein [Lachnospiraceae bacterium]